MQRFGCCGRRVNDDVLSSTGWEVLGSSMWASGLPEARAGHLAGGNQAHADAPELWDRLAGAYHAATRLRT